GVEVGLLVADEEGLIPDNRKIRHGADQHAGLGFAVVRVLAKAFDRSFLVIGAVIDAVDPGLPGREFAVHPRVERLHLLFGVVAACDAGLVGNDEHPPAVFVERLDRLRRAFDPFEVFRKVDVSAIDVQDAVSVQEQGWARRAGGKHVRNTPLSRRQQAEVDARVKADRWTLRRKVFSFPQARSAGATCGSWRNREERMDQLLQFLPYILNGVGGAVLAPILAGLLGGKGLGGIGNIIAGIVGGVGVGAGAQAAGL